MIDRKTSKQKTLRFSEESRLAGYVLLIHAVGLVDGLFPISLA